MYAIAKLYSKTNKYNNSIYNYPSYQFNNEIVSNIFYNYLKNQFNGADPFQGMFEFKQRTSNQLSEEKAEKNFLRLLSGNINEHIKMARDLDFKTPKDGATFYSGMQGKKKAWKHAANIGSKAIEQTPGGNTFETWDWFNDKAFPKTKWGNKSKNDQSIVWSALSQVYAENAQGQAQVFQEYEGNIWKNYEKPTLNKRGIPYIVHKIPYKNNT